MNYRETLESIVSDLRQLQKGKLTANQSQELSLLHDCVVKAETYDKVLKEIYNAD